MALEINYTLKGILWVIFFGLAKLFQYSGLSIIGVEGIKRLKQWWYNLRNKNISKTSISCTEHEMKSEGR